MLYIVATPIGNLEDITLRAITVLQSVDLILAEDTRVTRVLMQRYNINKEVISYHEHSTIKKIDRVIELLKEGKNIALVSDAGTPGINDPGSFLVKSILESVPDCKIVPIPGANAAVAALSISGFPADKFVYLGFPPHKKGRQTFFKNISDIEDTIVFYESKYRIMKALEELRTLSQIGDPVKSRGDGVSLRDHGAGRPLMVGRELTKQFETVYRGTADEIERQLKLNKNQTLGEFVVVIGPK